MFINGVPEGIRGPFSMRSSHIAGGAVRCREENVGCVTLSDAPPAFSIGNTCEVWCVQKRTHQTSLLPSKASPEFGPYVDLQIIKHHARAQCFKSPLRNLGVAARTGFAARLRVFPSCRYVCQEAS